MSTPSDLKAIVDVKPLWVMIAFLCFGSNLGHVLEALIKVFELILFYDSVPIFYWAPAILK